MRRPKMSLKTCLGFASVSLTVQALHIVNINIELQRVRHPADSLMED